MAKRLTICAIIAARNEAQYLRVLLPILASQGIDVAIIDNESTDGSQELYSQFAQNIISVTSLSYKGYFSLSDQLATKNELLKSLINYDWILHHDADEIMEHYKAGLTLRDAIEEANENGHNALNFDEFVFLPEPGNDYFNKNYYVDLLRYYFFEPHPNRLNRAWKRNAQLSNISSGGHILSGNALSISSPNHILRHYIVLSYDHAQLKYLNRSFDIVDLNIGWHGNRLDFNKNNLKLPINNNYIYKLSTYDQRNFCRANPTKKHFWEWG